MYRATLPALLATALLLAACAAGNGQRPDRGHRSLDPGISGMGP